MNQPVYLLYLLSLCGLLFSLYWLAQGKSPRHSFLVASLAGGIALTAPLVIVDIAHANMILLCMAAGSALGLMFLMRRRQTAFALSLTALGFATTSIALALCLHDSARNAMNAQSLEDALERFALATTLWTGGISLCGAPLAAWLIRGVETKTTPVTMTSVTKVTTTKAWSNNVFEQTNRVLWSASVVLGAVVVFLPFFPLFPMIAACALLAGVALSQTMHRNAAGALLPALFNTFGGISTCALGFVLGASVLIVAGALLASAGVGFCRNVCVEQEKPFRLFVRALFGGRQQQAEGGETA